MAHTDWTSSSSRRIQPRAMLTKYDTRIGGRCNYDFYLGLAKNLTITTNSKGDIIRKDEYGRISYGLPIYVGVNIEKEATSTNYLQIVGNKETNGFPVDFTITNREDNMLDTDTPIITEFNVSNNNTYNCIIKSLTDEFPLEFIINITKWSIPNTTIITTTYDESSGVTTITPTIEEIFSHIGFDIKFDLVSNGMVASEMCPTIELPYDGTNDLEFGIKTSQFNLQLNKDTPNRAVVKTDNVNKVRFVNSFINPYILYTSYKNESGTTYTGTYPLYGTADIVGPVTEIKDGHKYFVTAKLMVVYTTGKEYIASQPCPYVGFELSDHRGEETLPEMLFMNHIDINGEVGAAFTDNFKIGEYNKLIDIIDASSNTSFVGKPLYFCIRDILRLENVPVSTVITERVLMKEFAMVDLTELFGSGNEPTIEWCNTYLSVNEKDGSVLNNGEVISVPIDIAVSTKSKFIADNIDNVYIDFDIKLDKETSFVSLGNFYVTGSDYNEISNTFNIELKDNTKLLQENNLSIIYYIGEDVSTLNDLFFNYISKEMKRAIGLEFYQADVYYRYTLPRIKYPYDVKYIDVCKKFCETMLLSITQDSQDITALSAHSILLGSNTERTFTIHNNQCYSMKLYNNINNSIKNVSYETLKYSDSDTAKTEEVATSDLIYTVVDGYMKVNDYEKYGDSAELRNWDDISVWGYTREKSILIPKLRTTIITFTIPISQYDVNRSYSMEIQCNRAVYWSSDNSKYIPSADGKTKKYLHTDKDGNISVVDSTDSLTDNDYATTKNISIISQSTSISEDKTTITFTFNVSFNAKYDTYSYYLRSYLRKIGRHTTFKVYEENYIGAIRCVLVSSAPEATSKTTTTQTFTNGNGNLYSQSQNEFIQTEGMVTESAIPMESIASYNANLILSNFAKNKSVVELEWIGSPYICINDIIKLDNGLDYRVYYIEHKIDGGYRQKLKLVQKEGS